MILRFIVRLLWAWTNLLSSPRGDGIPLGEGTLSSIGNGVVISLMDRDIVEEWRNEFKAKTDMDVDMYRKHMELKGRNCDCEECPLEKPPLKRQYAYEK